MTHKILTGNRLSDGLVVYLGAAGWTPEIGLARHAGDAAAAESLLAEGRRAVSANELADAWLIDAEGPRAVRRRERIRARGPTVRADPGYRALREI